MDGRVTIKGTKTGDERIARIENGNLVLLRAALGTPGDPDTYAIDGGTKLVNPGVISDRFVSVRSAAHVRNVSFHQLRKFHAAMLHSAGVPDRAIADTVGWKPTRMLDVYVGSSKAGADAAGAVELQPETLPTRAHAAGMESHSNGALSRPQR